MASIYAIHEEIMERGWSESRQAFVQSYGSESLDASNLIMPLVFLMSPTDPRMLIYLISGGQPPIAMLLLRFMRFSVLGSQKRLPDS